MTDLRRQNRGTPPASAIPVNPFQQKPALLRGPVPPKGGATAFPKRPRRKLLGQRRGKEVCMTGFFVGRVRLTAGDYSCDRHAEKIHFLSLNLVRNTSCFFFSSRHALQWGQFSRSQRHSLYSFMLKSERASHISKAVGGATRTLGVDSDRKDGGAVLSVCHLGFMGLTKRQRPAKER
jgi:hypothetical protein